MSGRKTTHPFRIAALALAAALSIPLQSQAQTYRQLEKMSFQAVALSELRQQGLSVPAGGQEKSFARADRPASLPAVGRSEPRDDNSVQAWRRYSDSLEDYQAQIAALETSEGAYAPGLAHPLMALGTLYQREGRHAEALAAFERAEHITRVNYGLYSLDQVEIGRLMIDSFRATDRKRDIAAKQEYILYLHQRSYGRNDPRAVPALLEYAQWQMEEFDEGVHFEAEGIFMPPDAGAGNEKDVRILAFDHLHLAQRAYLQARDALQADAGKGGSSPELLGMEWLLLKTYLLQAHHSRRLDDTGLNTAVTRLADGTVITRDGIGGGYRAAYRHGKETFERILGHLRRLPDATEAQYASALMEYGDWFMLFGYQAYGLDKYEEAHRYLRERGYGLAEIRDILHPEMPQALPTVMGGGSAEGRFSLLREDALGYVDVSFTLNKFGQARDIETLDRSGNTSSAVERRLISTVRDTQFRPRMEGKGGDQSVNLRYYYRY